MKRKNRLLKHWTAGFAAAVLALALAGCGSGKPGMKGPHKAAADAAAAWLQKTEGALLPGKEWTVIALTRGEYLDIFSRTSETYQDKIERQLDANNGALGNPKEPNAAAYPPTILAMTAVGKKVHLLSNGDLTMGISVKELLDKSGVFGYIGALLSADSGPYVFKEGGTATRDSVIKHILSFQSPDGSFSYEQGGPGDVDTTAMAVSAFAKALGEPGVQTAVDKAIGWLESRQSAEGGYGFGDVPSCESASQVAIALAQLKKDPAKFGNGKLMDFILSFQNKADGSFSRERGKEPNLMTTQQALLALVAENRLASGRTALYDMSDVYGSSHNKLSPSMMAGVRASASMLGFLILTMVILFVRSRFIIAKWRREGRLDEKTHTYLTDEDLAARKAKAEAEEKAKLEAEAKTLAEGAESEIVREVDATAPIDSPSQDKQL